MTCSPSGLLRVKTSVNHLPDDSKTLQRFSNSSIADKILCRGDSRIASTWLVVYSRKPDDSLINCLPPRLRVSASPRLPLTPSPPLPLSPSPSLPLSPSYSNPQILTVRSLLPLARIFPSGLNATDSTHRECADRVLINSPLSRFHNLILPYKLPPAKI